MATRELEVLPENLQKILDISESKTKDTDNLRGLSQSRIPTIIGTTATISDSSKIIECWVNPQEMGWTTPVRGSIMKTKGGSVRFMWRNRERGTFFDESKISITFASGNILPQHLAAAENLVQSVMESGGSVGYNLIPPGLDNFYAFLNLLNSDPQTPDGRENLHLIYHNSPVFPGILLKGWFDPPSGAGFQESAESGWEIKWTASFEVLDSVPKLYDLEQLRSFYADLAFAF